MKLLQLPSWNINGHDSPLDSRLAYHMHRNSLDSNLAPRGLPQVRHPMRQEKSRHPRETRTPPPQCHSAASAPLLSQIQPFDRNHPSNIQHFLASPPASLFSSPTDLRVPLRQPLHHLHHQPRAPPYRTQQSPLSRPLGSNPAHPHLCP